MVYRSTSITEGVSGFIEFIKAGYKGDGKSMVGLAGIAAGASFATLLVAAKSLREGDKNAKMYLGCAVIYACCAIALITSSSDYPANENIDASIIATIASSVIMIGSIAVCNKLVAQYLRRNNTYGNLLDESQNPSPSMRPVQVVTTQSRQTQ